MFDVAAFRALIEKKGVKYTSLARAMGITKSTLYRKMVGLSDFTRSEIQACCDFLGEEEMNSVFLPKMFRKRDFCPKELHPQLLYECSSSVFVHPTRLAPRPAAPRLLLYRGATP